MTGRPHRGAAGLLGALAGVLLGALAAAGPALAHGADAPAGTDYRTAVVGLTPAVPGLRVRVIEAGARLELTNTTGRSIEVLGYAGEPYLEIRPDGVYENTHSPATYSNETLDGDTPVPADADPALPPDWRRTSTEPVARWHDQRTHWLDEDTPAPVRSDPRHPHRVRDWVVPLRDGTTPVELRGTLDWQPPPSQGRWWLAGALGTLLVGALGLLPARSRAGPAVGVALPALAAAAGLGGLTLAAGRAADGTASGPAAILAGLFGGQLWMTLTGLGALAAAGYALTRRPNADFALALGGTCLGIYAGAANGAYFANSVVPVPWPAPAARVLVAVVLALGLGVTLAAVLRLRAARPDPAVTDRADVRPASPAVGKT